MCATKTSATACVRQLTARNPFDRTILGPVTCNTPRQCGGPVFGPVTCRGLPSSSFSSCAWGVSCFRRATETCDRPRRDNSRDAQNASSHRTRRSDGAFAAVHPPIYLICRGKTHSIRQWLVGAGVPDLSGTRQKCATENMRQPRRDSSHRAAWIATFPSMERYVCFTPKNAKTTDVSSAPSSIACARAAVGALTGGHVATPGSL